MKRIAAALLPLVACSEAPPEGGTAYVHTPNGILQMSYTVEGDRVVVDDMTFPVDDFFAAVIDEADLDDAIAGGRDRAAVRAIGRFRWPGARIPYRFAADMGAAQQAVVTTAIAHWEANTPFRFPAYNAATDTDFVTFAYVDNDNDCQSDVGRSTGEQIIEVSNCSSGNIIHEIGHAVGFFHEQSRYDRDSYVTVNWEHITAGKEGNFARYIESAGGNGRDGTDVGDYDYGSIMHYGTSQFSADGQPTLTPRISFVTIGQRTALSRGDIDAAIRLASPGGTYSPWSKITLFDRTNYDWNGAAQSFPLGMHSATAGQFVTLRDNTASSMMIPPGMMAEIWTGAGPNDPHTWLGTSSPSLWLPWNDSISAIRVSRAVTAYRDNSQTGVSQTFRIGTWKASAGDMNVVGNNQISSLYVPPGLVAELCDLDSGGTCQTYEGNTWYVGDALNNKASLIRVKGAVTIFDEEDFFGDTKKSLTSGTYTSGSFAPVANNAISSMIVGDGLQATLCRDSAGTDKCEVFRGDVTWIGPVLDNNGSYLKVETITTP